MTQKPTKVKVRTMIRIGAYTISKFKAVPGDFWIEHESGEATQVCKEDFENLIDKFYKEIF